MNKTNTLREEKYKVIINDKYILIDQKINDGWLQPSLNVHKYPGPNENIPSLSIQNIDKFKKELTMLGHIIITLKVLRDSQVSDPIKIKANAIKIELIPTNEIIPLKIPYISENAKVTIKEIKFSAKFELEGETYIVKQYQSDEGNKYLAGKLKDPNSYIGTSFGRTTPGNNLYKIAKRIMNETINIHLEKHIQNQLKDLGKVKQETTDEGAGY